MKVRTLGAAAAALLALTISVPAASADSSVESERYGGSARARTLDVTVQGQGVTLGAGVAGAEVDPVHDDISVSAAGIGATLEEATMVAAGMGESNEGCVAPQLGDVFGALNVDASVACGAADVDGTDEIFTATGLGSLADLRIASADVIAALFDVPELEPVMDETFGTVREIAGDVESTVDDEVDPVVSEAVGTLNATLDDVLGTGDVVPSLDVSDTLGDLLDRLTAGQLVDVRLGTATGTTIGDAATFTSRAVDEGAHISLLPGFMPDGTALATIEVEASSAEVVYHRGDASTEGASHSPTVRVSTPLFAHTQELDAGDGLTLFCGDDPVSDVLADAGDVLGPLCTEISVGHPTEREVNGRLQIESAVVTVHALQGLGDLIDLGSLSGPGLLRDVAGEQAGGVLGTVNGVLADLGLLDEGVARAAGSDHDGVRLVLAGSIARAGGAKVLGETETNQPFEGSLPRTGGAGALPLAATGLLGVGAALRALIARR